MDEVDITALLQKIRSGDESALMVLYDRFANAVYSVAYRVLNHDQDAEEVAQDVFLRLWNKASSYDPNKGRFLSWLLTITRRMAIDRLRKRDRQTIPDIAFSIDQHPSLSETLSNDDVGEMQHILRSVLDELPDEQREAIMLAYFYGMSHADIAAYLERPLGTIKSHIRLGMQKLRTIWLNQQPALPKSENKR